jgi:hypothetical protein
MFPPLRQRAQEWDLLSSRPVIVRTDYSNRGCLEVKAIGGLCAAKEKDG